MNRSVPMTKGGELGMQKFAAWLKFARSSFGMSQRELADAVGLERKTILCFETCKRAPRLDDICRMMECFGVDRLVIDIRDVADKSDN
ncbi:helix-turn-helix transcriptional regulator [Ruminococcus sp.]|uniref:helix-turn-helix transcriptional regulator n=1 Tax=Ruminococcus sp. TaxID=41978 RepID=UPI0038643B96